MLSENNHTKKIFQFLFPDNNLPLKERFSNFRVTVLPFPLVATRELSSKVDEDTTKLLKYLTKCKIKDNLELWVLC